MQCDASRPGCLKCSQKGLTCPGYRDQQDLMFRNQTSRSIGQKIQPMPRQIGQSADSPSDHAAGQPSQTKILSGDAETGPASPNVSLVLPRRDRVIPPDDRGGVARVAEMPWRQLEKPFCAAHARGLDANPQRRVASLGSGRNGPLPSRLVRNCKGRLVSHPDYSPVHKGLHSQTYRPS